MAKKHECNSCGGSFNENEGSLAREDIYSEIVFICEGCE